MIIYNFCNEHISIQSSSLVEPLSSIHEILITIHWLSLHFTLKTVIIWQKYCQYSINTKQSINQSFELRIEDGISCFAERSVDFLYWIFHQFKMSTVMVLSQSMRQVMGAAILFWYCWHTVSRWD